MNLNFLDELDNENKEEDNHEINGQGDQQNIILGRMKVSQLIEIFQKAERNKFEGLLECTLKMKNILEEEQFLKSLDLEEGNNMKDTPYYKHQKEIADSKNKNTSQKADDMDHYLNENTISLQSAQIAGQKQREENKNTMKFQLESKVDDFFSDVLLNDDKKDEVKISSQFKEEQAFQKFCQRKDQEKINHNDISQFSPFKPIEKEKLMKDLNSLLRQSTHKGIKNNFIIREENLNEQQIFEQRRKVESKNQSFQGIQQFKDIIFKQEVVQGQEQKRDNQKDGQTDILNRQNNEFIQSQKNMTLKEKSGVQANEEPKKNEQKQDHDPPSELEIDKSKQFMQNSTNSLKEEKKFNKIEESPIKMFKKILNEEVPLNNNQVINSQSKNNLKHDIIMKEKQEKTLIKTVDQPKQSQNQMLKNFLHFQILEQVREQKPMEKLPLQIQNLIKQLNNDLIDVIPYQLQNIDQHHPPHFFQGLYKINTGWTLHLIDKILDEVNIFIFGWNKKDIPFQELEKVFNTTESCFLPSYILVQKI